ncbi:MAG: hypothetical protein KDE19_17840 [Caldilineaceae bacterium]|nr:hypothetical protein [Caldilineaceae bacterium]
MNEQESVLKLLTMVVIFNMLVMVVLIYAVMPDLIPGPVDDIAVGVGAYQLASRTGMLQQVMMLIAALMPEKLQGIKALQGGGDNDTTRGD